MKVDGCDEQKDAIERNESMGFKMYTQSFSTKSFTVFMTTTIPLSLTFRFDTLCYVLNSFPLERLINATVIVITSFKL